MQMMTKNQYKNIKNLFNAIGRLKLADSHIIQVNVQMDSDPSDWNREVLLVNPTPTVFFK